jgi:hypothetical protein
MAKRRNQTNFANLPELMSVSWFMENIRISHKYGHSHQSQQFSAATCFSSSNNSSDHSDKVTKNSCYVRDYTFTR